VLFIASIATDFQKWIYGCQYSRSGEQNLVLSSHRPAFKSLSPALPLVYGEKSLLKSQRAIRPGWVDLTSPAPVEKTFGLLAGMVARLEELAGSELGQQSTT